MMYIFFVFVKFKYPGPLVLYMQVLAWVAHHNKHLPIEILQQSIF